MEWCTEAFTTPPSFVPDCPGIVGCRVRAGFTESRLCLAATLALTATACDSGDDKANGRSTASSSHNGSQIGDDKIKIPDAVKSKLKEHGIDVDQWKNVGWKNWDKDK